MIVQSVDEWIEASGFIDLSASEIIERTTQKIASKNQAGQKKELIVFDLDSTLFDISGRTFHIIKDWVVSAESEQFQKLRISLSALKLNHVGYSLTEIFQKLGIFEFDREDDGEENTQDGIQKLREFWKLHFFSNNYLECDKPYQGSEAFVKALYDLGVDILYLTGRDEINMGLGTRQSLRRFGFPSDHERVHIRLKPHFEVPDLEYKRSVVRALKEKWNPLLTFENEPINLCMFRSELPITTHVFVQTVSSQRPAPVQEGLVRLRSFEPLEPVLKQALKIQELN